MKPWHCINCSSVIELDRHGRCEVCGSDSVDVAVRPAVSALGLASAYLTVADLERMMLQEDDHDE
jgi:hypothetical protein